MCACVRTCVCLRACMCATVQHESTILIVIPFFKHWVRHNTKDSLHHTAAAVCNGPPVEFHKAALHYFQGSRLRPETPDGKKWKGYGILHTPSRNEQGAFLISNSEMNDSFVWCFGGIRSIRLRPRQTDPIKNAFRLKETNTRRLSFISL